jgi:hypothetical protein
MRLLAAILIVGAAACGSPLAIDTIQPDAGAAADTIMTTLPAWPAADCSMFNPVACRLDLAQTSVGIDVNYPNVVFCGLQLLPTRDLLNSAAYNQLAAAWQVSLGNSAGDQTVLTASTPQGVLEYPLGTQQLYFARVTFASNSSDTIAALIGSTLGAGVSLYAVPLTCPGRR